MNSSITKIWLRANVAAATLCLLLLLGLAVNYPNVPTMWSDRAWATRQIQGARTIEEMTALFQAAVIRMSQSQSMTNSIFSLVMFALFIGFLLLCVNFCLIRRSYREISKDDHPA